MTEQQRLTDESFGDRLSRRVSERASQLVVGLDPDPRKLWPRAYELASRDAQARDITPLESEPSGSATHEFDAPASEPATRAALAVAIHCALVIEAIAEHAVAVKLQVACFERLGAPGWAALAETVHRARDQGLLVIADGKRGDIDVTAAAYGQAFFGATSTPYGEVSGLSADALTVNPLLGGDSLGPLVAAARAVSGGLFVLVRTSNPGAADLQDLRLQNEETISERLATLTHGLGAEGAGETGLHDVGAVVGATAPQRLARLRELMPHSPFLLPGIGAQGGRVEDLLPALGDTPASMLVSSSRAIVDAGAKSGSDPAEAARQEAARVREVAWSLRP